MASARLLSTRTTGGCYQAQKTMAESKTPLPTTAPPAAPPASVRGQERALCFHPVEERARARMRRVPRRDCVLGDDERSVAAQVADSGIEAGH